MIVRGIERLVPPGLRGRGPLWIDGDVLIRNVAAPAGPWLYRMRKMLGWRVPERLGERLARRDDAGALAFLGDAARTLPAPDLVRIAAGFADALARETPARLRRVAQACREGAPERVAPAVAAALSFEEARQLAAARARRSALAIVRDLRRPPLAGAVPSPFDLKVMELEARLLQRIDAVPEARKVARAMMRAHPTAAIAYDLMAQILHPTDPEAAIEALRTRFAAFGYGARRSNLMFAELLAATGRRDEARRFLVTRLARAAQRAEYFVGLANLDLDEDPYAARTHLSRYWAASGLELRFTSRRPDIDAVGGGPLERVDDDDAPLVTVVMTAFNAEAFIATAMRSVLAQSWRNLELLVADDLSADRTVAVAEAIAAEDPRVRVIRRSVNAGTYVAKNGAIAEARGAFVALMDSDDWWHPRHVELHMKPMRDNRRLALTTSDWIRMEESGRVTPTREGGYQHLNPASTLFRAEVFRDIGYFDSVRIGADSEFLWRLRHRYGRAAELHIAQPLAIGRLHAASLTQSGVGSYDAHNYSPARLAYWEAWAAWHRAADDNDDALRLPAEPMPVDRRPFPVPAEILP